MSEKIYSTRQVVKITDVSVQRLHHWSAYGVFEPYDQGGGRGTTRKFSYQNLLEIIIAKHLSDIGLHINLLKSVMNKIHADRPDFFNEHPVINDKLEKNLVIMRMVSLKSAVTNLESFEEFSEKRVEYYSTGDPVLTFDISVYKSLLEQKLLNGR